MSVKVSDMSKEAAELITLRRETIECTILFSIVWSIGATSDEAGRSLFSNFLNEYLTDSSIVDKPEMKGVKTLLMLRNWENPMKKQYKICNPMPFENGVYGYSYNPSNSTWNAWEDQIDQSLPGMEEQYSSNVANVITVQLSVLPIFNCAQLSATCGGPTGTGKSVFINKVLNEHLDSQHTADSNCIQERQVNQTQDQVDQRLDAGVVCMDQFWGGRGVIDDQHA